MALGTGLDGLVLSVAAREVFEGPGASEDVLSP
jgi:hypothetical protein